MDITRIALYKRQLTLFILFALVISGIQAFNTIPRAQDPGFIIRAAQVITYFPGASPQRVESLITDKLEEKIRQIPELDYVKSESKTGVSIVTVNIKESYTEMRPIWDNLRRKVDEAANNLPDGASTPQVNDEFGDVYGLVYAITGDGFSYAEIKDVADNIRDELLLIDEVAKVDILGAQEERIYVEYSHARLNEMGLSPKQLASALSNRNIINPGGEIFTPFETLSIEPSGNFDSIEELKSMLINIPSSQELVALGDIANVYRGYLDPARNTMRYNGDQAIGVAISLREGGNIIALGEQVRALMKETVNSYPIGIEFNEVAFEADIVNKTIDDFISNLIQAILVVTSVMLVFLGLRTGIIVAALIPVTIATAMFIMNELDIGLDQISLAALMISLGLLVDNAIVMAESIMVKIGEGESRMEAALSAANELKIPLLTSSLTTSAAFLPIYLAESALGEYTAPLFQVVTITLLCSLAIALTLIPLLCMLFIKVKTENKPGAFDKVSQVYTTLLTTVLRYRLISLGIILSVFVAAIAAFAWVPKLFFPPKTDPIFTVEVEFPLGTPIAYTSSRMNDLDRYLTENHLSNDETTPGLKNWATFIGNGGIRFVLTHSPKPASSGYAFLIVNTTEGGSLVDEKIQALNEYLFESFSDAKVTIKKLENGTAVKYPVGIRITGKDTQQLFTLANEIKQHLASINGTRNINDDWGLQSKKLQIAIDSQRAQRAGLTHSDIASALQTAFSGITLTEFREGDEIIPVVMRSSNTGKRDYATAGALGVLNNQGVNVPIAQVAEPHLVFEPAQVFRRNSAKTIEVSAELSPGITANEINQQLIPLIEKSAKQWPAGYGWTLGGEAESSGKANQSIGEKLPIAGFIIFILLMAQFNCVRRSVIILVTIPLALIGVSFGLLIAKSYFGFMTFLGVISLAGIVINNAIVLLDKINQNHDEKKLSWADSVMEAAQSRLRPILLTTLTTVLGLIPLYLGGGPMWEPMAVTIIFGLLISTILTLGVIPLLFSLFFRIKFS